jgi:GNAT superfamily N-acetyltransferase
VARAPGDLRLRAGQVPREADRGGARALTVVAAVEDPAERSALCRRILDSLPEWFGLPDAIDRYVEDVAQLPVLAVADDGFLALKLHGARAAEIYVMGIRPERHGEGLGSSLVEGAEAFLRESGVEYLQVKTLGPSHPSEHYARTRRFYESRGFVPLEELASVWGEANPCLIMIKHV